MSGMPDTGLGPRNAEMTKVDMAPGPEELIVSGKYRASTKS